MITSPSGTLVSNAVPLTLNATPVFTSGGLRREVWNNNPGGAISDLTGDLNYPRFPDSSSVVTSAEVGEGGARTGCGAKSRTLATASPNTRVRARARARPPPSGAAGRPVAPASSRVGEIEAIG